MPNEARLRTIVKEEIELALDKALDKALDLKFAAFFGEVVRYFDLDKRFDQKADKSQVEKLQQSVDGLAKSFSDEEAERKAAQSQLTRHDIWIHQLAEKTDTHLQAS